MMWRFLTQTGLPPMEGTCITPKVTRITTPLKEQKYSQITLVMYGIRDHKYNNNKCRQTPAVKEQFLEMDGYSFIYYYRSIALIYKPFPFPNQSKSGTLITKQKDKEKDEKSAN